MTVPELDEAREFYAKMLAAASESTDPRLERAFELVPREAFVGKGPWKIRAGRSYVLTPSANPVYLYQNTLVALNAAKGINNGEPFLHAKWLGLSAPKGGDTITHIGAGTGYYTAILSVLALPDGHVTAFEIDENLAAMAKINLRPFENAAIIQGNAVTQPLPPSDVIYVNAGVSRPPVRWLDALKMGGRMICPWCPRSGHGLAILVTRTNRGLAVEPFMPVRFIPCTDASSSEDCTMTPQISNAWRTRSLHKVTDRQPDSTAIAIYGEIWMSCETL